MGNTDKIGFENVENLIGSICTLVTPLKKYNIPESIKFIKDLGAFFGFGDSNSSLVKDITEMKELLMQVDESLKEIKNQIQAFEEEMKKYLTTLSQEMQQLYSLVEFNSSTERINNLFKDLNTTTLLLYEDMAKLKSDPKDSTALYEKSKAFFSDIYTTTNRTYLKSIRGLVKQIIEDQGIFPNDQIGIAYYKFLKTYAAWQGNDSIYVRSMYLQFELKVLHSISKMVYMCSAAIKFQLYNQYTESGKNPNMNELKIIKDDLIDIYNALIDCMNTIREQRTFNFASDVPKGFQDMKHTEDYIYCYSLGKSLKWEVISTPVQRIEYAKNNMVYSRDILYLKPGDIQKLTCFKYGFFIQQPDWISSEHTIVSLDSYGRIFAVNPGMVEIKVNYPGEEAPYNVTVVVESNIKNKTENLKPLDGSAAFQYKAGQTFKLSELLTNSELIADGQWQSSNPEFIHIEDSTITIDPIISSVMCSVSGYATYKTDAEKEKIFCYAALQVEGYPYKDEIHLFCPEDYEHISGHITYKKLIIERDIDLSNYYYSKYLLPTVDFVMDGNNHSLVIHKYTFTNKIEKSGCVMNLILKGSDFEREYGVTATNAGIIKNLKNYLSIAGEVTSGGICQFNDGTIEACENHGTIKNIYNDPSKNTGGICCTNRGTIIRCNNYGNIINGGFIGGICAMNLGILDDCKNVGELNTSNGRYYSKIAAICIYIAGSLKDCTSGGRVYYPIAQAGQQIGGILHNRSSLKFNGCSCETKGPDGQNIPLYVKLW